MQPAPSRSIDGGGPLTADEESSAMLLRLALYVILLLRGSWLKKDLGTSLCLEENQQVVVGDWAET